MLTNILNYRPVSALLAASGQPSEHEFTEIAAQGYLAVINLALHDDPSYSLPDERGTVMSLGMEYVHIPVLFAAPTDDALGLFFAALDGRRATKTWVHCAANKRASVFLGLYWHLRCGKPAAEAFELQRGIWEPDEVWQNFIARHLAAKRDL